MHKDTCEASNGHDAEIERGAWTQERNTKRNNKSNLAQTFSLCADLTGVFVLLSLKAPKAMEPPIAGPVRLPLKCPIPGCEGVPVPGRLLSPRDARHGFLGRLLNLTPPASWGRRTGPGEPQRGQPPLRHTPGPHFPANEQSRGARAPVLTHTEMGPEEGR